MRVVLVMLVLEMTRVFPVPNTGWSPLSLVSIQATTALVKSVIDLFPLLISKLKVDVKAPS